MRLFKLNRLIPYLLLAPSLALTLFALGYPVYDLVRMSLHEVNRFGMLQQFVGLQNFSDLLRDPLFAPSLYRTLVWTFGIVVGTVLLSLPVALILNEPFIGRGIARTIILLPWAVSLAMTAIVWRWALSGQHGLLNATLMDLGLINAPIVWLATAQTSFPIAIGIGILVSIPFTVTVFLGGLSSVPGEIYDAARVDGATGLPLFRYITLPLLKPFFNLAVILNVIYVFNSFPIIWVLTEGGPANTTDILVTYLYKLAFRFGDLDVAATLSLIMFAILLAISVLFALLTRRGESRA
ncbi:MAG: sugar ABC transporter permease [Truepera sp.]|nr:sugar ABC transporter permease [Truepera sp.]